MEKNTANIIDEVYTVKMFEKISLFVYHAVGIPYKIWKK